MVAGRLDEILVYAFLFGFPILLTALNIYNYVAKLKVNQITLDGMILFLGIILTRMLFFVVTDNDGPEVPYPLYLFAAVGVLGFLKLIADDMYSFARTAAYMEFIVIGIMASLFFSVFVMLNIKVCSKVYLLILPLNYIISGVRNIKKYMKLMKNNCYIPKNSIQMKAQDFFVRKRILFYILSALLAPLFFLIIILAYAFISNLFFMHANLKL